MMNPKVRVALSFIDRNLSRDIYVAEVAHLVMLSRSRFSDLFKSEVGIPFAQYLKKARLEKARQLLEESFIPVKVIATQAGYNDSSYFEREYKKAFGSTPSQHRASYFAQSKVKEKSA